MKILKLTLIMMLASTAWLIGFTFAPAIEPEPAPEQSHQPDIEVSVATQPGFIDLINEYRAGEGLSALNRDENLDQSAQLRADEIADCGRKCYGHTRPTGAFFDTAITGNYAGTGENLAQCFNYPNDAMIAWINSDTHNANMLGQLGYNWTVVGVGTAWDNNNSCHIIAVHFGA